MLLVMLKLSMSSKLERELTEFSDMTEQSSASFNDSYFWIIRKEINNFFKETTDRFHDI